MRRVAAARPVTAELNKTSSPLLPSFSSPWLFFAVVFCWSWSFWILAAVLGAGLRTGLGLALFSLGLLGPMLSGIGFAYLTRSVEEWREYWLRIVDPMRISTKWYMIIFLIPPVLMAVAVLLDTASGEHATLVQAGKRVTPFLSTPSMIIPFLIRVFLNGPLPEELGWRGYVLDRLQERWNPLVSSLVLGGIWALFHLPLFFIQDTYHHLQGAGSPWFWLFMAQIIPLAVIFTWIFNNTRRSTLGAILFHFINNVSYELGNVTEGTNLYMTALWCIAAAAVLISGRRAPGASK